MQKRNVLISCSVVLLMVIGVLTATVPSVRAAPVGVVCIQPTGQVGCTPTAPTIAGAAGTNVTVNVNIAGSDTLGGVQISVLTDPTILNPVSLSLTGNVITTNPFISIECINGGVGTFTNGCTAGFDTVGVVTVGYSTLGGLTVPPTTGLLFTITYNVVTTTTGTPISYVHDAANCFGSVQADLTECILVSAGAATQPETAMGANFANGAAATSLVAVVSGTDGNLYWSPFAGTTWGAWSPLAGQTPSSPSLCASSATTSELVVRGNDNSIYHKTFTSGSPGSFQATWDKNPTGVTNDSPVCQVIGTTLYVVVRGATNELFATTFDLTAHTWAATWTDLLGASSSTPALVATPAVSRLDLVVRGTDNGIYHKAFTTAGAWAAAWDSSNRLPTPDRTFSSPVIVSDGSQIHVAVVGTESNIWYTTLSFAGVWGTYTSLSGAASVTPALTIDSAGALHLVVRGFDAQMYSKSKPSGGAWDAAWVNAGGVLASGPAAVVSGSSVAVLVQGVDNTIWYNTLTGATWSGFVTTNGQTSRSAGISTP